MKPHLPSSRLADDVRFYCSVAVALLLLGLFLAGLHV
jgi:hypothetical protein